MSTERQNMLHPNQLYHTDAWCSPQLFCDPGLHHGAACRPNHVLAQSRDAAPGQWVTVQHESSKKEKVRFVSCQAV